MCILEEHYNKKVPLNVEKEATKFQNIINHANKKFGIETKHVKNPVRAMLENNTKYPVRFPSPVSLRGPSTCSTPTSSPLIGIPVPSDPIEEHQQLQAALNSSMSTCSWPPMQPMQGFYIFPTNNNTGTPNFPCTFPVPASRSPVCTITSPTCTEEEEDTDHDDMLPPKKRQKHR